MVRPRWSRSGTIGFRRSDVQRVAGAGSGKGMLVVRPAVGGSGPLRSRISNVYRCGWSSKTCRMVGVRMALVVVIIGSSAVTCCDKRAT